MELNQLDYFRTVAELENMTKAAEKLYVSQPNLSTSISRLESSLGVQLFERTKGRIRLTETGKRFLAHVKEVFRELDAAVYELQEGQVYREDSVTLGASFFGILSRLFPYYYQDYGLVPTTQMVLPNALIGERIAGGSLDVGVMTVQPEQAGLVWEKVTASPLIAVMKAGNPLAAVGTMTLDRLKTAHFICNTIYYERELLNKLCANAGFVPRVVRTSNEQEEFDEKSFDFGENVTICPLHIIPDLVRTDRFDLHFAPLADPFAAADIFLVRREKDSRTPFVAEFYECAKGYVRSIIEEQNGLGRAVLAQL